MQFRNINTAINQELGRIAGVQHHAWGIRNPSGQKSIYDKPLSFETWFLKGLRHFESKGVEFELLPGMVKITWPGQTPVLRTIEDFKREHEAYKQAY